MNRLNELDDAQAIQSFSSLPTIMKVITETTGLRFICVARVTLNSWATCAASDQLGLGLKPGDPLDATTVLCNTVRASNKAIFISSISKDAPLCDHPTSEYYHFESYFSVPIYRPNGTFFGTLTGLDPTPVDLSAPKVRDTLTLFADLISRQIASEAKLISTQLALRHEREASESREQFVAVLGHDLRTPLSSIMMGAESLQHMPINNEGRQVLERIGRSAKRISSLIDDVTDLTTGRMGGGLPAHLTETKALEQRLRHVVYELKSTYPDHIILADIQVKHTVVCDPKRLAQLLSNLLVNAIIHGDGRHPIKVEARCPEGRLEIIVSNAGPAIPKDTIDQLFQPFWRGSDSKVKGLGLGLYIASEIAHSHNGTLKVESTSDLTTFAFSMNLSPKTPGVLSL